jgi:hypothetical protein
MASEGGTNIHNEAAENAQKCTAKAFRVRIQRTQKMHKDAQRSTKMHKASTNKHKASIEKHIPVRNHNSHAATLTSDHHASSASKIQIHPH